MKSIVQLFSCTCMNNFPTVAKKLSGHLCTNDDKLCHLLTDSEHGSSISSECFPEERYAKGPKIIAQLRDQEDPWGGEKMR